MTSRNLGNVVDYLRRIVNPWPGEASDHDLLAHFLATRDESAFAALLKRHGPMVFGVSRRVLSRVHDAEDVVQATFLLLARKAATIRRRASVGCWLHGVARRLSIQLKRREMARLKRETRASATRVHGADLHVGAPEIQELLDTALQELPEKYRAALILCYLEGHSQEEAARQLGCPLGTVRSRLARGRALLQKTLTRRGLSLSAAGLTTLMTVQIVSARLPTKLLASTIQAATQFAFGTPLRGLVSASVAWLVQSGLKSVALTKLVWISVGIVTMGVLAGGAGLAARHAQAEGAHAAQVRQQAKGQSQPITKVAEAAVEKPRTDLLGDPLPPGALVRLGTTRLRHGDEIKYVGFSADGKTILSADWHGVHVWEASTGKHLLRFGDPRDRWQFDSISASADNRIVALSTTNVDDGEVEIWDATKPCLLRRFQVGAWPRVALSADGTLVSVFDHAANGVRSLRVFDATTGNECPRPDAQHEKIDWAIFSKDCKSLITAERKSIRFRDVLTGKITRQFGQSEYVGTIMLAPDGKTLAAVTHFSEVELWDLATGKVKRRVKHNGDVDQLLFSPDSKTLLTGGVFTTRWWDVTTGRKLANRMPSLYGVRAMAFAPDGATLATGGIQGQVQIWDLVTGRMRFSNGGHQAPVTGVAFSPNGQICATGGGDKVIRLWKTFTGDEIRQLEGSKNGDSCLAFVNDGRLLIATGIDAVRISDLATGKEIRRFPGTAPSALSHDGKLIVSAAVDGVHLHEIAAGLDLRTWHTLPRALAFSFDKQSIFCYGEDKKIHIWQVTTGKELRQFEGHHFFDSKDQMSFAALSNDNKLVAFGSNAKDIALYDVASGKQIRLLHGHTHEVTALAFSPDSRMLASADLIGGAVTVRLWEIVTGQEFQSFAGHEGRVSGMAFSPDGKLLLTGSGDTSALVWDLTGTRTGPKPQPLTAQGQESAWSDLSSADAVRGQKAVRTLQGVPEQAVVLLAKKLKPATIPDANALARCLANLDSGLFKTRDEAMRELENMGDVAAPALRKALAGTPSLELKNRLEALLEKFSTSQRLRTLRAVQVLELIGTPSSQALLNRLAAGVDSLLTREAKAAVERMAKVQTASVGR